MQHQGVQRRIISSNIIDLLHKQHIISDKNWIRYIINYSVLCVNRYIKNSDIEKKIGLHYVAK